MATAFSPTTDAEILAVVVAPDRPTLSPEVARGLLELRFTTDQEARIHELLDKNSAGTLSESERVELEGFGRVGNFLSLVQAKARLSLTRNQSE